MGKLGPFHHQFIRSVIAENILTSFMRSLSIHYALNLDSQHVSDLTVKEIPYARAFGGYFWLTQFKVQSQSRSAQNLTVTQPLQFVLTIEPILMKTQHKTLSFANVFQTVLLNGRITFNGNFKELRKKGWDVYKNQILNAIKTLT